MKDPVLPGNPPIPLILRRSARARRISLRISQLDGRVTLTMPKRLAEREALAFAETKQDWIRQHLAARGEDVIVAPGAEVPVGGKVLRVRGGQGVDHPGFQALLSLLRETDHGWAKLASWYRLSDQGPPYDDMTPLARALIAARRDRIVWGTNWPHPILWDHPMPNDTDLFDQFMEWCGDDATRKQILVDNPAQLYGFE